MKQNYISDQAAAWIEFLAYFAGTSLVAGHPARTKVKKMNASQLARAFTHEVLMGALSDWRASQTFADKAEEVSNA